MTGACILPLSCVHGREVDAQVLWNTILCKIATNKSTEIVLEPNPHLEQHQPAPA